MGLQLQLIWVWKAQCLLKRNVSNQALLNLQVYSQALRLPDGVRLKKEVEDRINLYNQIK
jgi:hypothetical protein